MWLSKSKALVLLLVLALATMHLNAQESNLERFTPSALFDKGTFEINTFYNLYTQNQIRNRNGDEVDLGQRQTFLNGMYQFTYGVSASGRVNLGLDVVANRAFYDDANTSPLKVLVSNDGDFNRTVVSAAGPRIKVVPIASIPNFSVQSSFLFPIASNLESPSFTAHDRYTWFTQFFYDKKLNSSWRLFLEVDALYRLKRNDSQVNFVRFPLSAFLSYFPSSKTTIFAFGQYAPRFEKASNAVDEQFGLTNWFTQVGIGAKYQLTSKMGLELSYGNFIQSRNDGAGYSLNFGIRYIKR